MGHRPLSTGKTLVTVPYHNRDLKRGTLRAILRQTGMTPDELHDLM
jgi:predicted RNA binding protein YcfA (HicA-like mRNA interferase family)